MHVCGKAVNELLNNAGHVSEMAGYFSRIQLNFCFKLEQLDKLKSLLAALPSTTVITQHNVSNERLWLDLRGIENHATLFDTSGGRGIVCDSWPKPLPEKVCGYAGGLGPCNLADELPKIRRVAARHPHWLDMESSLRNQDDTFDLTLVGQAFDLISQQSALL